MSSKLSSWVEIADPDGELPFCLIRDWIGFGNIKRFWIVRVGPLSFGILHSKMKRVSSSGSSRILTPATSPCDSCPPHEGMDEEGNIIIFKN